MAVFSRSAMQTPETLTVSPGILPEVFNKRLICKAFSLFWPACLA
jgi:hypothetical protein